MQTLRALYDLYRPANGLITALSVGVGGLCSQGPMVADAVLTARYQPHASMPLATRLTTYSTSISIALIDPKGPCPLSALRCLPPLPLRPFARSSVSGWAMPLAHSTRCGPLVSVCYLHFIVSLKTSVLWGNGLVGLISAAAFPYGALACGSVGRAWIPGIFALLFHLGREIVKDVEDRSGDRLRGDRTLPLRYGTRTATGIVTGLFALLMVFTLLPYFYGLYGILYLLGVFAVHVLLLYVLYVLYAAGEAPSDGRQAACSKSACLAGLAAVVAGEWMRSL